jgi:AraC-like DNA-binding protein
MRWQPYHKDWKPLFQGELGLRVHWFGRYGGYPKWSVRPARLAADMVSFFFVEKGSCWAIVNDRRMVLRRGDLLVIRGGEQFSYGHDPARPHVSLSASLALRQGSAANLLLHRRFKRRYAWRDPAEFVREFEKVLRIKTGKSRFRDLELAGAVLQWLAGLLARLRPPLLPAADAARDVVDRILAAEAWAAPRLAQVITLSDWARAAGLTPVYFGRAFKRETGLKPMEWLNQRRLQLARQQLANTRQGIAEIAEACGFASPFYFSRVFRKHFGQSPSEFRASTR